MRNYLLFLVFLSFSCRKPVAPLAPSDLTATVVSTTQVNLSWTDKSTNEAGFKIQRKTGNNSFTDVATTTRDVTTYSDNGLTPNTTYTYRVYAYNNAGASLTYTNEVTVTTWGLPSITTTAITAISNNSSKSGGNITSDGGLAITARGVVWSTSPNPTVALATKTTDGTGSGSFTSNITGLAQNTTYYVRAYATNSAGTAYGNEVTFTTINVDITTGLVGFWPFNGNANDASGNGNNGTVNGAVLTTDRFGNSNNAYSFSSGANLICTNNSFTNPNVLTYSVWIKSTSMTRGDIMGFNQGRCLHEFNWDRALWVEPNRVVFYTFPGAQVFNNASVNILDNTWHHVCVVFDNSGSKIYIDGQLRSTNTSQTSGQNITGFFRIGGLSPNDLNNSLIGSYDDIRIYNRALTQEQITYLYNN